MGCAGSHERARRVTDAFPAPGRLAAPLRPNFLSVSRLVRSHEPRHSGKFGNAVNVMRQPPQCPRAWIGQGTVARIRAAAPRNGPGGSEYGFGPSRCRIGAETEERWGSGGPATDMRAIGLAGSSSLEVL